LKTKRAVKGPSKLANYSFPEVDRLHHRYERFPNPPVTRNQVELMQVDNVSSPGVPGFAELGISPHSVENMLEQTSRSC